MIIPKLTIQLMMSMIMMMFVATFMMFFVAKIGQDLYLAPLGAVSKNPKTPTFPLFFF